MKLELTFNAANTAGTFAVLPDGTVPATPIPVPPVVIPPAPTPRVVAPPANPGERFGSSHDDVVWSNPSTSVALMLSATGDLGTAVQFVADAVAFPTGVKLNVINGYSTGALLSKEIVVSDVPHRFTTTLNKTNSLYCISRGLSGMTKRLYFVRPGHDTPASYDCPLEAGKTYYINVRHNTTGTRGTISLGLDIDGL